MRSTTIREEQLPLDLQQQIDACCDKFESALQAGRSPEIADFLPSIPPAGHGVLRRELTAIEVAYQRTVARQDSEALHLRCPHCQNQVELLDDARLEEITCNSCGDTFSLIDEDSSEGGLKPSNRIAHFELVSRLGTGGFGSVWEARDTELDRLVALKLPRKSQLSARETEQFFREARTAAQLKHPNIVPVHEVGKDGVTIFIVTDLIRGVPLSDRLKEVQPTAREAAELCATIAEALAYAHQRGVIHRDLKPSNVMLDRRQQPHIMDFGLAKREIGEITMTVDGTILGTPAYMSPEQALGKMHWVDRRTDIYSLGVMLFQMLTGELPFRGTAQQQIQQRIVDDAPDPRKLNAHAPADLSTIALKCLERDANKRFSTASEVAEELRRYLAGEPIKSRPISSMNRALRWAKRKPALATAGILTCVLAVAGPLTALKIYQDKNTIESQFAERNKLIDQTNQENDNLDRQLQRSQQQLADILSANPGIEELSFWHKQLISNVIEKNQDAREELLSASDATSSEGSHSLSKHHLAWTFLLRSAGEVAEAIQHGAIARRLLEELSQQQPENMEYRLLLAECLDELGQLEYLQGRRERATELAEQALTVREAISTARPDVLRYQLDQLHTLGDQVAFQEAVDSKSAPKKVLADWSTLMKRVRENLQVHSEDFYKLACYLTQRQALSGDEFRAGAAGQALEQDEVD